MVIWTTTPWTIPANRAVSFNPDVAYGVYECTALEAGLAFEPWIKPGDKLIIADKLAESVMKAAKAARASVSFLTGVVLQWAKGRAPRGHPVLPTTRGPIGSVAI